MRLLLLTTFIFFGCSSLGQACEVIDGKKINCLDSINRKQGFWEEVRSVLISVAYSGYGSSEGCKRTEVYNHYLLAEGNYLDNKKIGLWKYYPPRTNRNDSLKIIEKEVYFYPSGQVRLTNHLDRFQIEINSDSTQIHGFSIVDRDTITLSCRNSKCRFTLPNGKEILSLDYKTYNDFEFEFERLRLGEYNRKIRASN